MDIKKIMNYHFFQVPHETKGTPCFSMHGTQKGIPTVRNSSQELMVSTSAIIINAYPVYPG
jgi:hypothetical protein